MYSGLGSEPDASLHPLPQPVPASSMTLFVESGLLHLAVQQPFTFPPAGAHPEHTQIYVK